MDFAILVVYFELHSYLYPGALLHGGLGCSYPPHFWQWHPWGWCRANEFTRIMVSQALGFPTWIISHIIAPLKLCIFLLPFWRCLWITVVSYIALG